MNDRNIKWRWLFRGRNQWKEEKVKGVIEGG
jgi:hypothetical protein